MRSPFTPRINPDRGGSLWAVVRLFAVVLAAGLVLTAVPVAYALTADTASSAVAGYQVPSPFAVLESEEVTLPGGAPIATTVSLAGKCARVSCDTAAAFRAGPASIATADGGAPAVSSHDAKLKADVPESMCFSGGTTMTTLVFYSASSGTCTVSRRGP